MHSSGTSLVVIASLLASLGNGSSAFAQNHAPKKAHSYVAKSNGSLQKRTNNPERPILELAREKARKELAEVTRLISIENNKSEGYDACTRRALIATKKYDQWFLTHFSEFESLDHQLDSTIAQANAKIASLAQEAIHVIPVHGQKSAEIDITLEMMIKYFKLFNGRLKTCSKDSKNTLLQDMEDPDANRFGIAHSQVVAAMKNMSTNLNTSLKANDTQYEMSFTPAACGYNLELRVTLNVNGTRQNYNFSLLESNGSALAKIELGDAAKWSALTKTRFLVDNKPIDGMRRYRNFANQEKNDCKNFLSVPSTTSDLPFLTYSELKAEVEALKRTGRSSPATEMEFVIVEPGTFMMGSPVQEVSRADDEFQHQVTLTKEFEIQTTHVTQQQWFQVMGNNPSAFRSRNYCPTTYSDAAGGMCPNHPVEKVSWDDAQAFITKINAQNTGYLYRLPTEAEWEYASRGGNEVTKEQGSASSPYSFGQSGGVPEDYAWFDSNSGNQTHEVAQKKMNQLGLYDMNGQLWQWCQDWYGSYPTSGTQTDPVGAASGPSRVIRGGSSFNPSHYLRSARRTYYSPSSTNQSVGFRLVRTYL